MINCVIFLLTAAGFLALLLADPRYRRDWLRHELAPKWCTALRLAGLLLLALPLIIAVRRLNWGYGAVVWFGWLTISATLVVSAHTYRTHAWRPRR